MGYIANLFGDLVSLVPGIQSLGLWGSLDHRTRDPDDSDSESSTLKVREPDLPTRIIFTVTRKALKFYVRSRI